VVVELVVVVASSSSSRLVVFRRHDGPVWQLAWAHPVYGSVLATCGYDRKVILWKEQDTGWTKIYEYSNHDSSGQTACISHLSICEYSDFDLSGKNTCIVHL